MSSYSTLGATTADLPDFAANSLGDCLLDSYIARILATLLVSNPISPLFTSEYQLTDCSWRARMFGGWDQSILLELCR